MAASIRCVGRVRPCSQRQTLDSDTSRRRAIPSRVRPSATRICRTSSGVMRLAMELNIHTHARMRKAFHVEHSQIFAPTKALAKS